MRAAWLAGRRLGAEAERRPGGAVNRKALAYAGGRLTGRGCCGKQQRPSQTERKDGKVMLQQPR